MPTAPPRVCPLCRGAHQHGEVCPLRQQQKRDQDRRRPKAIQAMYGADWRVARAIYLASHPLCIECQTEGRMTPSTVVDHIQPHKGDYALFWDQGNWRAVCKRHSDIGTARYDGGFGNPIKTGKPDGGMQP